MGMPTNQRFPRSSVWPEARETIRTKYTGSVAFDYSEARIPTAGPLQDRVADVIRKNLDNPSFGMTPKESVAQYIHSTDPDAPDKLFG